VKNIFEHSKTDKKVNDWWNIYEGSEDQLQQIKVKSLDFGFIKSFEKNKLLLTSEPKNTIVSKFSNHIEVYQLLNTLNK